MNKKRVNQHLIICRKTKQFTDLIVCAANCDDRCEEYKKNITYEMLLDYITRHPEYEIIGELMPTQKTSAQELKKFWIVNNEYKIEEVTEAEIMKHPQKFIGKQIWQKPPFKYEIVITLKKIKAE